MPGSAAARLPAVPGYKILAEAGRGGMGIVYKAEQESIGRPVALKALDWRLSGSESCQRRFMSEARVLGRMAVHENIVQVHDAIRDNRGRFFIVMEHIDGSCLAEKLRQGESISLEESVRVGIEAARALQHAHEHGVIHRDVKPENIMVTPAGRVKVMDFGIAQSAEASHSTRPGEFLGTPHYMAPEQLRGGLSKVDARCDIYALGATLYYLTTGRLPFDDPNPYTIVYQHIHEAPKRPSRLYPAMPPDLERAILKALAKEPEERFQTAAEMAAALEKVVADNDLSKFEGPRAALPPAFQARVESGEIEAPALGAFPSDEEEPPPNDPAYARAQEMDVPEPEEPGGDDPPVAPPLADSQAGNSAGRGALLLGAGLALFGIILASAAALHFFLRFEGNAPVANETPAPIASPAPTNEIPSVVETDFGILDFEVAVKGVDPDLGRQLAEETGRRLAAADPAGKRRAADSSALANALLTLGLSAAGASADPDIAADLGRQVGARRIVAGAISRSGDGVWSASARMLDARTGAVLAYASVEAPDARGLLERAPDLATHLESGFAARPTSPSEALKIHEPGEVCRYLWHDGLIKDMAFVEGGRRVLTASWDGETRLWDIETGDRLRVFRGHNDWVTSLDVSPDETRLLTSGRDRTTRLWDLESGQELLVLRHPGSASSAAFSPDGRQAVTGCYDQLVRLWSLETGAEERAFEGHTKPILAVAFLPDGKRLVSAGDDGEARVWNALSGWPLRVFPGVGGELKALAVAPGGERVLTAGRDSAAVFWNIETGEEIFRLDGHGGTVWGVAISPNGLLALTACHDKKLRLWNLEDGQLVRLFEGHAAAVNCADFGPGGRRAISGSGSIPRSGSGGYGEAILWNLP
jgi:serine/threonine protein kinase/WD40 repeat protein